MASIAAFPQEPAIDQIRKDANRADLEANLESDEEHHRDRVNLFAAVAVVLLIAAGWWIANSFIEMQKVQGCYASGTRYCSLI